MPQRDRTEGRLPRAGFGWADNSDVIVQKGPSNTKIVLASLALAALIGGGIWAYVLSQKFYVQTDAVTLCPTERPIAEMAVVVLDVSDRFTDLQRLALDNHLTRLRDALPRFALIEAYTIEGAAQRVPEPLVHLCNPGKGDDLNRVYQNPKMARDRWESGFAKRLDEALDELLMSPGSLSSPIFEAIQSVAVRSFSKPEYDAVPKRLIVFSDLLHNVPGKQSHYRDIPHFENFRGSDYFSQVRSNLTRVQVSLYYLNRSDVSVQGGDHIRFWQQYFAAQGARVRQVERIYGDR